MAVGRFVPAVSPAPPRGEDVWTVSCHAALRGASLATDTRGRRRALSRLIAWSWLGLVLLASCKPAPRQTTLLNVSYDPTRELYAEYNAAFARHLAATSGEVVNVKQSHGGSGTQARAVIDGLEADVVTLAIEQDINAISQQGLLAPGWKERLPFGSAPYTSSIVLIVRGGNPRNIRDWADLTGDGIAVITPNPKTGGGARLNYLAARAFGLSKFAGDAVATRDFVARIYRNVAVLDSGARGAAMTFVERGIGDVLIAWESEAELTLATRARTSSRWPCRR